MNTPPSFTDASADEISNICLIAGGDKLAIRGHRWGTEKKASEERGGSVRAGRDLGVVGQRWNRPKDTGKKAPVAQPCRERCWTHTGVRPRTDRRDRGGPRVARETRGHALRTCGIHGGRSFAPILGDAARAGRPTATAN
ncbi:hypothetical protein NDU88_001464 [Pleurodeles waltl]|uniref:Uncharacterized protein n=1 Tax=Pleurodeles waltl TaxID=8319 RepID=A0AAV7NEU2_PLEWA|nr:hypothetical protein NDU88_001464 [Pleurodeles waltl]